MSRLLEAFSILKRIEASATSLPYAETVGKRLPFSILKRIEASATVSLTVCYIFSGDFQYPQADRSLCNQKSNASWPSLKPLSVSSSGSKPLQQPTTLRLRDECASFSILKRIEASATRTRHGTPGPSRPFSILKRIEASATDRDWKASRLLPCLSVSSSGSKPLQRAGFGVRRLVGDSFSILKRIEASATPEEDEEWRDDGSFSILKRIEASATACRSRR